jgi:DNA-binding CsgD family transcriptional regulator
MGLNCLNIKKAGFARGIIGLFLTVMWLNFFPFYGPGYYALGKSDLLAPHLFTAAHILALIAGSWIYTRMPTLSTISFTTKLFPVGLAVLTMVSTMPAVVNSDQLFSGLFFLQGLLSGFLISRWMVWFSSEETVLQRGSIFGKIVGLSFIILSVAIILSSVEGYPVGYLFSALAVLIGGYFCAVLPLPESSREPLEWSKLIPPADLLIFAALGYASVSMLYYISYGQQVLQPALAWVQIVPYVLISFVLAKLTDKSGLLLFQVGAFLFTGLGFTIYTINSSSPIALVAVGMLIPAGMICIHFYYWLSLVERQSKHNAPFYLSLGVSFELAVFALVYAFATEISISSRTANMVIGIYGIVLALLGITFSAYTIYRLLVQQQYDTGTGSILREHKKASIRHISNPKIEYLLNFYMENHSELEELLARQFNLTPREIEVAYYLFLGYSNEDIKNLLFISMNTLKFHIRHIYSKIGVSKREKTAEVIYDALINRKVKVV